MGGRSSTGGNRSFRPKEFLSGKDSDRYFDYFRNDSILNEDALYMYTDIGMRINDALRKGESFIPEVESAIDEDISRQNLKDDIYVYRAGSNELLGFKEDEIITQSKLKSNNLIGATLTDKAFVSTTTLKSAILNELSYKLGDNAPIYRIHVKPGKGKGIYVEPVSAFKGQYEYLLKRNTSFKVVGAHKDSQTGRTIIDLEC